MLPGLTIQLDAYCPPNAEQKTTTAADIIRCPSSGSVSTLSHDTTISASFHFVDETDYRNPQNHKKILSAIRSRAKLDYHAKQRKSEARFRESKGLHSLAPASSREEKCLETSSTPCLSCQSSDEVLIKTETNEQLCQLVESNSYETPRYIDSLISGTWEDDLFREYNLPRDPRVPFLVSHFNERFRQTYTSLEGHTAVFTVNLMFPVLHHLMLYHTGAFLIAQNTSIVDEDFVTYHRTKSMRLVHDALDDPEERSSDHVIAALLFLGLYEEMYGTTDNAIIHRNGLKQVLELRKKSDRRISWFLRMLLPLNDLQILTESTSLPHCTDDLDDGVITVVHAELEISESSMWDIFSRLRDVSQIILLLPPHTTAKERRRVGFETGVKIERFLKVLDIDDQKTEMEKDTHRSWLFACLLYLHTIESTSNEIFLLPEEDSQLIHQLRVILDRLLDVEGTLGYSNAVLLWVLYFGGLHSKGKEYMWFRKTIRKVCMTLKAKTWDEIRYEMRDLPWVELGVEWKLKALCGLY